MDYRNKFSIETLKQIHFKFYDLFYIKKTFLLHSNIFPLTALFQYKNKLL